MVARCAAAVGLAAAAVTLVGCTASSAADAPADPFERTRRRMSRELGPGFTVDVVRPFVMATNAGPATRRNTRDAILVRYYEAFYRDFMDKRPDYPISVYLFRDDKDFKSWAAKLFGDRPKTPFGYYKAREKALVMNITTGGGTLVHEMTHALTAVDFPAIPAWFNEALGSLYEACTLREGRIVGIVNWRYPRLKEAIEEGKLIPLADLVALSDDEFYDADRRLHYAEARYFAMYMQERRLLRKFYRAFRDDRDDDPTGRKTLERVFGKPLEEVQEDWIKWARTLTWRGS
jgi:hypothetical protein